MNRSVIIGQYIPGNSPIHKIHPSFKIVFSLVYIIVLFIVNKPIPYIMLGLFTAACVFVSRVKIRYIVRGMKPILWIIVITVIINLFFTGGTKIMLPGGHSSGITYEGVSVSLILIYRLFFLVAGTSLLTLTTKPLDLTYGTEMLLMPLRAVKVPAKEIAMMMSISIRFIPILSGEADKIRKAQISRGADVGSGNILKRARAMVPMLIPLFISAFRRADDLATAMETRCYSCGENATRMKEIRVCGYDIGAAVVFAVCLVILFLAQILI